MKNYSSLSKDNLEQTNGGFVVGAALVAGAGYFIWNTGYTIGKDIANQNRRK